MSAICSGVGSLVAGERDARVQGDLRDEQLAVLVLRHDADRLVLVASTTKRFLAAMARNVSMWQLDIAATKASSGSTASSRDRGNGTTEGEADAGDLDAAIEAPHMAAAVAAVGEVLSVPRVQRIVAVYSCAMAVCPSQEIDFTNSWYCSSVMSASSSAGSVSLIFMNQPRPAGSSLTVPGATSRSPLTSTTSPETGA